MVKRCQSFVKTLAVYSRSQLRFLNNKKVIICPLHAWYYHAEEKFAVVYYYYYYYYYY
jgi:CRISPR/Cas system-associated protein Csx1